jgi:predicted phage tail protein
MANRKQNHMWWTVAVILTSLWLPGLLGGYTAAGVTHIVLSLALVAVLFGIIQGRRLAREAVRR